METDTAPGPRVEREADWLDQAGPAETVRLLPVLQALPQLRPLTACLGLTDSGQPLLLRMASADGRHVLVSGAAGAGKTELLRTVVASLALTHRQAWLQVALIEPLSGGFLPLAGLRHRLAEVATDPTGALTLLERVMRQVERRRRERFVWPHIVVAVDDLTGLLAAGGPAMEDQLLRLARHGREAGLHLVAGVQQPDSLPAGLLGCFPARCRALGAAPGEFRLEAAGQSLAFQAAWLTAQDWAAVG